MYSILVIAFGVFMMGSGLFLYAAREGAASFVGGLLSLVGLCLVLITIVAWLVPGFFYNIP